MENCTFTPPAPALTRRQLISLRVEYFAFALIPICLVCFGIIPKKWEYHFSLLLFMSLVSVLILFLRVRKKQLSWSSIGLTQNLKKGAKSYVLAISIAIICFFIAPYITKVRTEFNGSTANTLICFTFLGSPMQEFLFRVYLWTLGAMIFTPKMNFTLNVFLFVLMHMFYDDLAIVLPAVIPAGIVFTWLFKKHQNYILAALNHTVWGALALYVFIIH